LEEERRLAELQKLKDAVASAQAEAAALKDERAQLKKDLFELQNSLSTTESQLMQQLKALKSELEAARRDETLLRSTAELDKKHMDAMLANKERQLEDQQTEYAEKEARFQRQIQRLTQTNAELEVDRETEVNSRKELIKKTRELTLKTEGDITLLREDLQRAQSAERRAKSDHDMLSMSQKDTTARLAGEQAQNSELRSENQKLVQQLNTALSDLELLKKKLDTALQAQADIDIVRQNKPSS
jgi:chromosome segregation ATPase